MQTSGGNTYIAAEEPNHPSMGLWSRTGYRSAWRATRVVDLSAFSSLGSKVEFSDHARRAGPKVRLLLVGGYIARGYAESRPAQRKPTPPRK